MSRDARRPRARAVARASSRSQPRAPRLRFNESDHRFEATTNRSASEADLSEGRGHRRRGRARNVASTEAPGADPSAEPTGCGGWGCLWRSVMRPDDDFVASIRKVFLVALLFISVIPALFGIIWAKAAITGTDFGGTERNRGMAWAMTFCDLAMPACVIPLYVVVRVTGRVQDFVVDIMLLSMLVTLLGLTLTAPMNTLPHLSFELTLIALSSQSPRWPLFAGLSLVLMGISGYNHVVIDDPTFCPSCRVVALPGYNRTQGSFLFASQFAPIVIGVAIWIMVYLQNREHQRHVASSHYAVLIARDAADALQRYDTESVRYALASHRRRAERAQSSAPLWARLKAGAAAFVSLQDRPKPTDAESLDEATLAAADLRLLTSFEALVHNLEAYRPFLPHWIMGKETAAGAGLSDLGSDPVTSASSTSAQLDLPAADASKPPPATAVPVKLEGPMEAPEPQSPAIVVDAASPSRQPSLTPSLVSADDSPDEAQSDRPRRKHKHEHMYIRRLAPPSPAPGGIEPSSGVTTQAASLSDGPGSHRGSLSLTDSRPGLSLDEHPASMHAEPEPSAVVSIDPPPAPQACAIPTVPSARPSLTAEALPGAQESATTHNSECGMPLAPREVNAAVVLLDFWIDAPAEALASSRQHSLHSSPEFSPDPPADDAMDCFVDRVHTIAAFTSGAVHSFVLGTATVSWNTAARAPNSERLAAQFLCLMMEDAGSPLVHVTGAAAAGNVRAQVAGGRARALTIQAAPFVHALTAAARWARSNSVAVLCGMNMYDAVHSHFVVRGADAVDVTAAAMQQRAGAPPSPAVPPKDTTPETPRSPSLGNAGLPLPGTVNAHRTRRTMVNFQRVPPVPLYHLVAVRSARTVSPTSPALSLPGVAEDAPSPAQPATPPDAARDFDAQLTQALHLSIQGRLDAACEIVDRLGAAVGRTTAGSDRAGGQSPRTTALAATGRNPLVQRLMSKIDEARWSGGVFGVAST